MKILLEDVHIPAGIYIQRHFDNKLTLLVHADAGAIPYYSEKKTTDFGGLNDEFLSHRNKLSTKQIIEYFFKVDADILAITSFYKDGIERIEGSLNWNTLKFIIKDDRFKKYSLAKIFDTTIMNYYEFIFIKNELVNKELTPIKLERNNITNLP